jgi:hypothetical protein
MKSCPTCNRTYADETLTFCLVDGSILSAPFDPHGTLRIPASRSTDPAPTEVLYPATRPADPAAPNPMQNRGGVYPQPGQYPYGAPLAHAGPGRSKAARAALIFGIISPVAYAVFYILIVARVSGLWALLMPLRLAALAAAALGLVLGIIGIIISKTSSSKVKASVGLILSVISLLIIQFRLLRMF